MNPRPIPHPAPRRSRPSAAALPTLLTLLASAASAPGADTPNPLDPWFDRQAHISSWQADVTQTRTLQSLTQPLTNCGRIWFQTPNSFRWELGSPPRTIAIRKSTQLLLLYPALQHAELYTLGPSTTGPWRDSVALLEAGFPRSREELLDTFQLLATETLGTNLLVSLQPKSPTARRWIPRLQITLATNTLALLATELAFADGSRLRNDFSNPTHNPTLDPALFSTTVPAGYQLSQPTKPGVNKGG